MDGLVARVVAKDGLERQADVLRQGQRISEDQHAQAMRRDAVALALQAHMPQITVWTSSDLFAGHLTNVFATADKIHNYILGNDV